jgi:signal transduction histidine kinase
VKVLHLLQIGNHYETSNLDSAELYYRSALALSRQLNAPFFEGKTISWFTDVLNKKGEIKEALQLNLRGYEIGKRIAHQRLTIASLSNIATSYQYLADYENTLKYQLEALAFIESFGDSNYLCTAVNNVSGTFQLLRQYEKAEEYARRSLDISLRSGNEGCALSAYMSLGVIADHLHREQEALRHFQEALNLSRRLGFAYEEGVSLMNIGDHYLREGQVTLALRYLNEGIETASAYGDQETLARLYLAAGHANMDVQNADAALVQLERGIRIARENHFRDVLKKLYLTASDAQLARGDYNGYHNYRDHFQELNDSLINESVLERTTQFETQFETAQKEQEILRLEKESEIHQLELRQRQGIITGLGTFLGLLAAVAFLYFQNLRNKQEVGRQRIQLQENQILRLQQEKQLTAVDAMLQGQEVERTRLARDLHDGLGGMLSGVKQTLHAMKGNQVITEDSARGLNRALDMLDSSIGELRRVARNMMPEALLKFGLHDAIRDLCDAINDTGKMRVQYQGYGMENRLPEAQEVIVYRIIQELVNNTIKHSQASQVLIQLLQDGDRVHLTVEDNGRGFDTALLEKAPGIGWLNIKSRVDYLGGTLNLRAQTGQGTAVEIEFKRA